MNFGQSIQTCMGKYATFEGRASRSEYWWFYLFTVLVSWGASVVGALSLFDTGGILSLVVNAALLLPSLAASTRRLHDTNRSGWWFLLAATGIGIILLIVWWAQGSDKSDNKYGSPPVS